ncbi:hypothetical protein [Frigidibacter oleivorans]|uniref:hypothetical protein n=1 Tax=Frigidibacter oleivorans TaxID=2487129 RepID=UPI0013E08AFA|nr:hypothetical protein [Frigidibacter oleivorans]
MTRIIVDTTSETGIFFVRHAGVSTGYKTLAEAQAAAEAIKTSLGGMASIKTV